MKRERPTDSPWSTTTFVQPDFFVPAFGIVSIETVQQFFELKIHPGQKCSQNGPNPLPNDFFEYKNKEIVLLIFWQIELFITTYIK